MSLEQWVVSEALAVPEYPRGLSEQELVRRAGRELLKLNANENPLGPSPKALAAIKADIEQVACYAVAEQLPLKLAERLALRPERITLAGGSNDVLERIARLFLKPGLNAVVSEYSFPLYSRLVSLCGAKLNVAEAFPLSHPSMPGGHNLNAMLGCIDAATRLVFIASPNNPTGTWLSAQQLTGFLRSVPPSCFVVLDEAYIEYDQADRIGVSLALLQSYPNLIITRTFSKIYGLAGLRVGYSLSDPELAALLATIDRPFSVNRLGLTAAAAALSDDRFVALSRKMNRRGIRQLEKHCVKIGFATLPTAANFLAIDVGMPASMAAERLFEQGVVVRPLGAFGLPNHIRVTIGDEAQMALVMQGLTTLAGQQGAN